MEMAMSARRALLHMFLPALVAVNLVPFAHYIHAQQCHMAHDKKARDGKLTFVLVRGLGRAFVTSDVPIEAVREILAA